MSTASLTTCDNTRTPLESRRTPSPPTSAESSAHPPSLSTETGTTAPSTSPRSPWPSRPPERLRPSPDNDHVARSQDAGWFGRLRPPENLRYPERATTSRPAYRATQPPGLITRWDAPRRPVVRSPSHAAAAPLSALPLSVESAAGRGEIPGVQHHSRSPPADDRRPQTTDGSTFVTSASRPPERTTDAKVTRGDCAHSQELNTTTPCWRLETWAAARPMGRVSRTLPARQRC